ncbi:hypothetical protein [Leisingera thetidis]|uniref:hypothetical protein n=1 Tax=Leisingera thetidis TaxID=2930199 RepID=UPI0021F73D75|nr:hypothetical protein [Leisingera thetidis]
MTPPSMICLEYYQPAFILLHKEFRDEVGSKAMHEAKYFQTSFLAGNFPAGSTIDPDHVWAVANRLLEEIERVMGDIISNHSTFFWHHLYRRTGTTLHRLEGEKTDPVTIRLVREILEIAFQKHGKLNETDDIGITTEVNPSDILGGWMIKGFASISKQNDFDWKSVSNKIIASKQYVITKFSETDFINLFRLQAYAYEYWRITALMRAVGKGASIVIKDDRNWLRSDPKDFAWLVSNFDRRNVEFHGCLTIRGNWAAEPMIHNSHTDDTFLIPIENTEQTFSHELNITTNFLPASFSAAGYLKACKPLQEAAQREFGFSLHHLLAVIHGLTIFGKAPTRVFTAGSLEQARILGDASMLNLVQRGYTTFTGDLESLGAEVHFRFKWAKIANAPDMRTTLKVLEFLSLTDEDKSEISLWSRGPAKIIIPTRNGFIINLPRIPNLLFNLSAEHMQGDEKRWKLKAHEQNEQGSHFESEFRRAFKLSGLRPIHQRIKYQGKLKGEIDAAVDIDGELYVFECYASPMRFDLERGKPSSIQARCFGNPEGRGKYGLNDKLKQVMDLCEFLEKNKIGDNYDFSKFEKFVPIVVSPFQEWIWEKSDKLWLNETTPRILSADEALEFVRSLQASSSSV